MLQETKRTRSAKMKPNTQREILKIRQEVKKKINKIDKSLTNHMKKKGEKAQINPIRNKKGEHTKDTVEVQGLLSIILRTCILINLKFRRNSRFLSEPRRHKKI